MNSIIYSFFFFLPAGIANLVPIVIAKLPIIRAYGYPLDFFKTYKGKRIFGDHKTLRGLVFGTIVGTCTAILVQHLFPSVYPHANPVLIGLLLSFGALMGDSVKSFFKRQVGIASGKSWFPFDQIDYIVGGIICSLFVVRLPFTDYAVIFILYFLLHLLVAYTGFLLHLKDAPI